MGETIGALRVKQIPQNKVHSTQQGNEPNSALQRASTNLVLAHNDYTVIAPHGNTVDANMLDCLHRILCADKSERSTPAGRCEY